jgi:hypothetical protein
MLLIFSAYVILKKNMYMYIYIYMKMYVYILIFAGYIYIIHI